MLKIKSSKKSDLTSGFIFKLEGSKKGSTARLDPGIEQNKASE